MAETEHELFGCVEGCVRDYFRLDGGADAGLNRVNKLVGVSAAVRALGGNGVAAVEAVRHAPDPKTAIGRLVAQLEIK